jgi:hypothetical protein
VGAEKYRLVPDNRELLQLYGCASFFKLLFQFFCFALGSGFLDGGRCTFDHVFGFFQTKAGDCTNSLDDANFLVAKTCQYYIELVFFSGGFATCVTRTGSRSRSNRTSLPLQRLNRRLP